MNKNKSIISVFCVICGLANVGCGPEMRVKNGVHYPASGFAKRFSGAPIGHVRFEGIYVKLDIFDMGKGMDSKILGYYRFWENGSVMFGYMPKDRKNIGNDFVPSAEEADNFQDSYAGRYRSINNTRVIEVSMTGIGSKWLVTQEYFHVSESGVLTLLPNTKKRGDYKVGEEFNFYPIQGMKAEPFW